MATSILTMFLSAGMAVYLRILASFPRLPSSVFLDPSRNSTLMARVEEDRLSAQQEPVAPAACRILELEPNTTLNQAERTVI